MKLKLHHWILIILFLSTLGLRLFFAFQTPYFSSDNAYFTLRQVEYLSNNEGPIFEDSLSYGGRTFVFQPLFHYILAFFSIFFPAAWVAKVLPNIFASSLVFISFLIAFKLTESRKIGIFTAVISAFIPIFFAGTINSISVFSFILPLMAFMIYCLFCVRENRSFAVYFVICALLISLAHFSSLLFALGLVFYLVLIKIERMHDNRAELELILFSIFLMTLIHMMVFRSSFVLYGPAIIWQNIPIKVISEYFLGITILGAIYKIGSVPFIDGIYITYRYIFKKRNHYLYLLIGFVLASALLIYFKLVSLDIGLMFVGFILVLLFAQSLRLLTIYIKKTRFASYENTIIGWTFVIFVLTSIVPSILLASEEVNAAISQDEVDALEWIRDNTDPSSKIVSLPSEGHYVAYFAKRQNVMDSNFMMIPNINALYDDVISIYKTPIETEAIALLNKHGIDYVYLSPSAKESIELTELSYVSDEDCFELVYDTSVKIYRSLCSLS